MHQEDRDTLRNAAEFILQYDETGHEEYVYSIEEAHEYIEKNGKPNSICLHANDGGSLGSFDVEAFINIDLTDLDTDNYYESSQKVNKIIVTYGDETRENYASINLAQEGIAETLNGCDLATNVECIEGYIGDKHVCNFTAEMVARLEAQPAV